MFHLDSATATTIKNRPIWVHKNWIAICFLFWILKNGKREILTFIWKSKAWRRLDLHAIAHVYTCSPPILIIPAILTNRIPGFADRWIHLQDKVRSKKSNCQKRNKEKKKKKKPRTSHAILLHFLCLKYCYPYLLVCTKTVNLMLKSTQILSKCQADRNIAMIYFFLRQFKNASV